MNDKELANAMVTYRAKHNLSQRKFAEMCNVTTQTIHQVEAGMQSPSNLTRRKIELAIGKEE